MVVADGGVADDGFADGGVADDGFADGGVADDGGSLEDPRRNGLGGGGRNIKAGSGCRTLEDRKLQSVQELA